MVRGTNYCKISGLMGFLSLPLMLGLKQFIVAVCETPFLAYFGVKSHVRGDGCVSGPSPGKIYIGSRDIMCTGACSPGLLIPTPLPFDFQ